MLVDVAALGGLALGTLLSEDLTSIGAGLLVRDGHVGAVEAVVACSAGVYLGDLGLWLAGRMAGRRLLTRAWFARRLDPTALEALSARLDARLPAIVLGSRFLPGSRLPMYVAAGIWGRRPVAFMAWSLLAVLLWTPALVLLTARFGPSLTNPLVGELGYVFRCAIAAGALTLALRLILRTRIVRRSKERFASAGYSSWAQGGTTPRRRPPTDTCHSRPAFDWVRSRFARPLASAEWARSTARRTRGCIVTSP